MQNAVLFEAMRRILESYENPRALNMQEVSIMVQGGKSDPEYPLGVACCFRFLAGDNWPLFCDIYNTAKKTDDQLSQCKGKLRLFWGRVKRSGKYGEFVRVAEGYVRRMGCH